MAKHDTVNHYFSGQGVMLVGLRGPDGKPKALYPVGNVPTLKIGMAVSVTEHKESHTGQRGVDKRMTTETKGTLSMVLEKFDARNLALGMRASIDTIAGGTKTDEKITGFKGAVTSLGFISVSDVIISTDKATPVTLTAFPGTAGKWDYKLNAEAGSISINPDEATWDKLVAGDFNAEGEAALLADFDYADQEVVHALTEAASEVWVRFEGLNTAENNEPVVVDVFKFSADPMKELALIADSLQQFPVDGSILADTLQQVGSQFFRVTKLKSAA